MLTLHPSTDCPLEMFNYPSIFRIFIFYKKKRETCFSKVAQTQILITCKLQTFLDFHFSSWDCFSRDEMQSSGRGMPFH